MMQPNEYQQLANSFRTPEQYDAPSGKMAKLHPQSTMLMHGVFGMCTELGELTTAVHKWLYYGQTLDVVNAKEELGDILWYLAKACEALGLPLEDVMEANIRKLTKRYPNKYTDTKAAEENRDREAERQTINGGWGPPFIVDTEQEAGPPAGMDNSLPPPTPKGFESIEAYKAVMAEQGRRVGHSYTSMCKQCRLVPLHRNNKSGLCGDCSQLVRSYQQDPAPPIQ